MITDKLLNISGNIKFLRKQKGWNQQELAKKIGMARISIANYETMVSFPGKNALKKLSEIFEVPIDRLVSEPIYPYKEKMSEEEVFKKIIEEMSIGTDSDNINVAMKNVKRYYSELDKRQIAHYHQLMSQLHDGDLGKIFATTSSIRDMSDEISEFLDHYILKQQLFLQIILCFAAKDRSKPEEYENTTKEGILKKILKYKEVLTKLEKVLWENLILLKKEDTDNVLPSKYIKPPKQK